MSRLRRAGVLLHPTSLPGPYGIGDLGPAARAFVQWLATAKQSIWQMLPITPPDGAGSPYASPSAFARNPLLLSIDDLVDDGWLTAVEKPWGIGSVHRVDHALVAREKLPVLHRAAERAAAQLDLSTWAAEHPWAEPWARYVVLTQLHGENWTTWPAALRDRAPGAVDAALDGHSATVQRELALQYLISEQWLRLRAVAEDHGVALWGDVPFFVGGASVDVWTHRDLFRLDAHGRPTVISGVPPDAFSPEGQVWGTPLYDEPAHAADHWRWWCDRIAAQLEVFHELRLDHFRGVAGVWEIPQGAKATEGHWIDGPGAGLLEAIRTRLGGLPLIAEDLGIITPDVDALRDDFALRGMAVLQFAFQHRHASGRHAYLPHNHVHRSVVYPGTHDNDTAIGWYHSTGEATRDHLRRYLSTDGRDVAWDLARTAWHSVAQDAVVPMQDLLSLGGDARMNVPGVAVGNWSWRMGQDGLSLHVAQRLAEETLLAGRVAG